MNKLKRVVIKEEYVALTGDYRSAIILNQFIYWSERVRDFDKFIEEENKRIEKFSPDDSKTEKSNGWIYKTADDLIDECMLVTATKDNKKGTIKKGCISRTTILNYIDLLIENRWLQKRNNPKYKWDKTLQYRVDLIKIAIDLYDIGYMLQEYSLPKDFYDHIKKLNIESTILNNRDSENENHSPIIENQDSENENQNSITGVQYQRLPTEITTKTTQISSSEDEENPIITLFKEIKGSINGIEKMQITYITNQYPTDLIIKAIEEAAVKADHFNLEYVKACLKDWGSLEGYENQIKAKKTSYALNKGVKKEESTFNNFKQREYDFDKLKKQLLGWEE